MPRTTKPLRLDALRALIENSGLDFNDKNKKSWVFDCPKCGKDERLYLRRRDGRFVCWYCRDKTDEGFEGAPEYALSLLLKKSVADIQDILYGPDFKATPRLDLRFTYTARRYALENEEDEEDFELLPEVKGPEGVSFPLDYYPIDDPRAARGLKYLQGRGVTPQRAQEYGLQYDAPRRRVVFPVVTQGLLVGWQARTTGSTMWVDDKGEVHTIPKILTTMVEGMRDNVLMFEPRLVGSPHAVLSEGPVDALKLHLCGGNVCSMGKSVSEGQLLRLKAHGIKRLYLAQDPDASDETALLVRRYHEDFEMFYLTPQGTGFEDFGAMSEEGAFECFKQAEKVHPKRIFLYWNPDAVPRF
jgi:hypothetical protein